MRIKKILILRRPQSGCLEGRTMLIQLIANFLKAAKAGIQLDQRQRTAWTDQQNSRPRASCAMSSGWLTIDGTPDESGVLTLARRHRLTVYDAAYLELALRNAVPLATLDAMLATAARSEGVHLLGDDAE